MLTWLTPLLSRLLAAAAMIGPMAAQSPSMTPTAPQEPNPAATAERAFRGTHDESQSRDLFTACDGDGDDRLDIFEAGATLALVRGPQDSVGFSRLDKDRDGFLSWPEFDQAFKRAIAGGGSFKVRPARPLAPPTPKPQVATKLQQFLQLHDANRNGGLDPSELDQFLRQANLPPDLGPQLRMLDQDRSGRLEPAELAPWLDRLLGAPVTGAAPSGLPAPWRDADTDGNQAVDDVELGRVLRRLDPMLASWAAEIEKRLDSNRDGTLQATELTAAIVTAPPPAAAPTQELPSRSPVR